MSAIGLPGYRETAAGWIPADWTTLSLGTIASVRKGKGVAKQGVPCVELEHVEPETGRLLGWDSSGVQASIKASFKQGDVLFGKLRPYLRKYAIAPFDGICTTEILAIHPRDDQSDSRFLFHLMQGDGVFATVEALSYGTKMPRVSWTDLSDIVLGIPPLPEQQKIAAILTTVDDKLDVVARQIETTQTLKQGLMQTLFSRGVGTQDADGRWVPHAEFKGSELGDIPSEWEVLKLGEIVRSFAGGTPNRSNLNYFGGDIPWVKSGEVNRKTITFTEERITPLAVEQTSVRVAEKGAILVAMYGATAGKVSRLMLDAAINQAILSIRSISEKCTNDYLYWSICNQTEQMLSMCQGAAQPNLSKGLIESILVVIPSIHEQMQISKTMFAVDNKLDALAEKQAKFQILKRGLMQKLLKGEWRVRVDANATGT